MSLEQITAVGRFDPVNNFPKCSDPTFDRMRSLYDQGAIDLQPNLRHRTEECLLAGFGRFQMQRAGDERDLLMSKRGQMLNCLSNSVEVVDSDIAHSRPSRPHVNEYQRHLSQFQVLEQDLFHTEGHNGDPFDAAFDHPPHRGLHILRDRSRWKSA